MSNKFLIEICSDLDYEGMQGDLMNKIWHSACIDYQALTKVFKIGGL